MNSGESKRRKTKLLKGPSLIKTFRPFGLLQLKSYKKPFTNIKNLKSKNK